VTAPALAGGGGAGVSAAAAGGRAGVAGSAGAARSRRLPLIWFTALMFALCFEGLGRRYLPAVGSAFFYFLKDAVLVFGLWMLRAPRAVRQTGMSLYGGFRPIWLLALVWTVLELFNPELASLSLGFIGLRAYWLWWFAPFVIAGVLQNPNTKRYAILVLVIVSIVVCALAILQFGAPADSNLNLYTVVDGEEVYASSTAIVSTTGRARVASTFAFLSGFTDFTVLVPALLLSFGLEEKNRTLRRLALGAALLCAAVLPMSGSRTSLLLGGGVLLITAISSGLLFTTIGRRVLLGAAAAAVLAVVAFPEAFAGVQDRLESDETSERLSATASMLPPVALSRFEYPALGIGTGMQQNAKVSMKIYSKWDVELEAGRYLVELGVVGFILIWLARLGLMLALLRAYFILKRARRRGAAGAALSYAALTFLGTLTFDHIWQALFFTGCGFILAEVMTVTRGNSRAPLAAAGAGPMRS
jgi:hypothetical protein